MSKLWLPILNLFNVIGDNSGCHQIKDRCFTINNYTFPICARCTGVFIGQLNAIVILVLGYRFSMIVGLILLGIMGLDWGFQAVRIKQSNNIRRLITGLLGGFGLFSIYISILIYLLNLISIKFNINILI